MNSTTIAQRRLIAQHITQAAATPAEVVQSLGAIQAQDYLGALWALGLRTPGATEQQVEAAIAAKQIVRTWPMRGTIHFVAPADVRWLMFAIALYAGLTMVTNVPFYSFKDISFKKSVPFAVIVLIALGIAAISTHPPMVLFGIFVLYGLSGYVLYAWRKARGQQVSVISTSTDEPDERGLHQ